MVKVKIDTWTISLIDNWVTVSGKENKKIPLDEFEEWGMITLPDELLQLVRNNIRHANTYDRFLEKLDDIS